jgi:putative phage-type endonuclease
MQMTITREQLIARKKGIGASDVAAIIGVSKYKGPLDLYIEKTSENVLFDEKENIPAELGNELEPYILRKYSERTGRETHIVPTVYHPVFPYMFVNPDGIDNFNCLVECKSVDDRNVHLWGEPGTADIPYPYLLQVAYGCAILNAPCAYVVALFGKRRVEIFKYERHETLESNILKLVQRFWEDHVLKRMPPKALSDKETIRCMNNVKSKSSTSKEMDAQTCAAYEDMLTLMNERDQIEERIESKKAFLCSFLNDTEELVDLSGKTVVSYKTIDSSRFDMDSFKKDHPKIYEEFKRPSSMRRFIVKKIKE